MAVARRVSIPVCCAPGLKNPLECNQPHSSCHSLLASLEGAPRFDDRVPCLQRVLTRRNNAIAGDIQWTRTRGIPPGLRQGR